MTGRLATMNMNSNNWQSKPQPNYSAQWQYGSSSYQMAIRCTNGVVTPQPTPHRDIPTQKPTCRNECERFNIAGGTPYDGVYLKQTNAVRSWKHITNSGWTLFQPSSGSWSVHDHSNALRVMTMTGSDYGDYPSNMRTWIYDSSRSYPNVEAQCSSGYGHLGCYRDTRDRMFSFKSSDNEQSLDGCATECMSKGYQLMAYQDGRECWCAHAGTDYSKYGTTSGCSNGKGGSWAADVYHLAGDGCNTPQPTQAAERCSSVQAGLNCITSDNVVDMVFVLDSSSSISAEDYRRYKEACASFIRNNLNSNSRVGILQFSHTYKRDLMLNNNVGTPNQVADFLMGINQLTGFTYMANAIEIAVDEYFVAQGRPNVPRYMVFITDGSPTTSAQSPCNVAQKLSDNRINVYAIGVGADASNPNNLVHFNCLKQVSGAQNQVTVLTSNSFESLRTDLQSATVCSALTPFDGTYEWTGGYQNSQYVYRHASTGYMLQLISGPSRWEFTGSGVDTMTQRSSDYQNNKPPTYHSTYTMGSRTYENYPVVCKVL